MEDKIAADAPLDYVTFQILPQNRYDARICSEEKQEVIGHGPLDELLEHLPNIKDQVAKNSSNNFKLELPDNLDPKEWFTKVTLTRFLHIMGLPDSLNRSVAISKEISQLEETRKFHLSLYAKNEDGITSSDHSKNELLRAMDSRLAALKEELVSTFNLAAGETFSSQEMMDLQKFCSHFGDEDVRNLLSKLLEMSQKGQIVVPLNQNRFPVPLVTKNDYVNRTGGNIQISGPLNSVKPVVYDASPAKAAEIERQSSTESEDSSCSDKESVERNRTLIRSASPRRSASPMRRIQIGRSGPRRTPALTIKSLACLPARERVSSHKDFGNDGILESEEPNQKTEVNATRMSVQDAINLFENKQRDQANDIQKRSFVDTSTNANKSVLRRWSAGMGESQKSLIQNISDNSSNIVDEDALKSEDVKPDMNLSSENPELQETVKVDMESETSEKSESHHNEDDVPKSQTEKNTNGKMDSVEWSRQKETKLSQMLMEVAEYQNTDLDNGKNGNCSLKQRDGFNGPHNEKRERKLQGENAGRRAQSVFRANQEVQDEPKAEKSAVKVSEGGKKYTSSRSQNVKKNSPISSNSKKESPKPAAPKKAHSKSSTLPATRKSWPSTPSTKATGTLPTKAKGTLPTKVLTGTLSGTTASRHKPQSQALHQKPQSSTPLSRPSPKSEKPLQQKDVEKVRVETKKSLKRADDSKNRMVPKSGKTTKIRPNATPEGDAGTTLGKTTVHKVTKKSSVVPLEAKPSNRKVSGTSAARNPTVQKAHIPTKNENSLSESEDPVNIQEKVGTAIPDKVHLVERNPVSETHKGHPETGRELETEKPMDGSKEETPNQTLTQGDEVAERMSEPPAEIQHVQEPIISSAAWVDSIHQNPLVPSSNSAAPSPLHHDVVTSSEPQVRLSLSQMLLEESSSEPDIVEWGSTENPPTMVYQKDAPKGLKRLLKFARRNRGEVNGIAWASPYTSEGEDDGDEYKNLARSNMSNSCARSSNKIQEGHPTSKGTKSFFSLSAFRSSKN